MATHLYRHYGQNGELLYVGISLSAINRLSQHRDHSQWFSSIKNVTLETYETREDALRAETTAILEEKPLYNIKKTKQKPLPKSNVYIDRSNLELYDKVVNLEAIYSEQYVANLLTISKSRVRRYIDENKIGSVKIGERIVNTKHGKRVITKYIITGWQLIEFFESVHKNRALPDVI